MQKLLAIAVFSFLICITVGAFFAPLLYAFELPDVSITGKFTFLTGFADVDGNTLDFRSNQGMAPGLSLDYSTEIGLEGQIGSFYVKSSLFYPHTGTPDFTLNMEDHNWLIQYQPYELKLPNLKTIFNNQKLTGLLANRRDQTVYIFHGQKNAMTQSKTFSVNPRQDFEYHLLDNGTLGDVEENSEKVFYQGVLLIRYVDYRINYLDGIVTLLTPAHQGAVLQVKYNYLPTGTTVRDTLTGAYYQYNFARSYVGFFYFDERAEKPEEFILNEASPANGENHIEKNTSPDVSYATGEPDLNQSATSLQTQTEEQDGEVESPLVKKQYIGGNINTVQGPISLTGEIACQLPPGDEAPLEYAGNLNFKYATPEANLEYDLSTATVDFQGIGVNSVIAGEKHLVTADYQLNRDWKLDLVLSQVKQAASNSDLAIDSPSLTRTADTNLYYQLNPKQRLYLSLDCDYFQVTEAGLTDIDYQLGWDYKISDKMSLTLRNSLKSLERDQIIFKMNSYTFNLQSEFKQYPDLLKGDWYRSFNTDTTWKPRSGITLIGDLDYTQQFATSFADSQRRIALTLLAAPNQKINTRTNYIYYCNPANNVQTVFSDVNATLLLPFNLQFEGAANIIRGSSAAAQNQNSHWHGNLKYPIKQKWDISYYQEVNDSYEYLKFSDTFNNKTYSTNRNLSSTYRLTPELSITPFINCLDSSVVTNGSAITNSSERCAGIKAEHVKDANVFKYQLDYSIKSSVGKLNQTISLDRFYKALQLNYSSEINYLLTSHRLETHKESLNLNWMDMSSPWRPTLQLSYQSKNDGFQNENGEHWQKYKASTKLTYLFSWNKQVFAELGIAGNDDYIKTDKSYWSRFIRIGTEIAF